MTSQSLAQKLLEWRLRRGYTQEDVGKLLRGVTAPTVGRWEKGQEIPGPVTICLECLLEGKIPFTDVMDKLPIKEAMWKLQMSLEAWEKLDALRLAGGYATVTDLIASLVQEELGRENEGEQSAPETLPTWRTGGEGKLDTGARHVAEESPPYVTGSKAVADSLAADWVAKNPPPGGAVTSTADNGAEPPEKEGGSPEP